MVPHGMDMIMTAKHDVLSDGIMVPVQIADAAQHEIVRKIHQGGNRRIGGHDLARLLVSHRCQLVNAVHFSVEIQKNNIPPQHFFIGQVREKSTDDLNPFHLIRSAQQQPEVGTPLLQKLTQCDINRVKTVIPEVPLKT